MNATLTHFIENGKIITAKGEVMEIVSINVMNVKTLDESELTIAQIENCEIYYSPEELEIQRLNKVIADQQEHIKKLMTKPEKPSKAGYKHITREEVREAEEAFKKGVAPELVASTYSISVTTAKRIQEGTHPKSTIARKDS